MTSPTVTRTAHESGDTGDRARPAVSLRELHAALLAGRPGQFADPGTTGAAPATTAVRRRAGVDTGPADDLSTGRASRAGGRPSSSPPTLVPGVTRLTVVATHGGAGARCLAAVLGAPEVCRSWPVDSEPNLSSPLPVLLVCRSNARGLSTAQRFAREYRDGDCTNVLLLGCAVVADAPGRLPIGLRRLRRLLAAAVPRLWTVPWVPAWRLAPPDPAHSPEWAVRLRRDLDQAVGP